MRLAPSTWSSWHTGGRALGLSRVRAAQGAGGVSPCPQGSARGVAGKVSLRTESRTSRVTPVLGALGPLIEKTGPPRPPLPQRVRWEGSGPRGPTNRRQKPILSQAGARSPEPGLGWAELPLSLGGATSWPPQPRGLQALLGLWPHRPGSASSPGVPSSASHKDTCPRVESPPWSG